MNKKSTSRWVVFAAWLLSMGATFLLGMLAGMAVKDGRTTFIGEDGRTSYLEQEAALAIRELTGREPQFADRESAAHRKQLFEAFSALNGISDSLELRYKARVLAQALDRQELLAVVQHMETMPQTPVRARVLAALLEQWARQDPRSALAYAMSPRNDLDHEGALLSVLEGWAQTAPADAWKWVTENSGGAGAADSRVAAVVLQAAKANPEQASAFAQQAPTETLRAAALQALLYQQLNRERPQQAARWLATVKPGPALDDATGYLAGEWARYAPAEAAAWAQARESGQGRAGAIEAVARTWGQNNPSAASAWVSSLPAGPARSAAAAALAAGWVSQGGAAGLALWLNAQDGSSDFDGAISVLAQDTALRDPSTALSWANAMADPGGRQAALVAIGRAWLAEEPVQARSTIAGLDIDPASKSLLLGESTQAGSPSPAPQAAPLQPAKLQPVIIQSRPPPAAQEAPAEEAQPEPEVIVEEVIEVDPAYHYDAEGNLYYNDEFVRGPEDAPADN